MLSSRLNELIQKNRVGLGMTQSELASRAKVSLPSVQKIESGEANPTLSTLEGLLEALGLELDLVPRPVDWVALVACGAPLLLKKSEISSRSIQPSLPLLVENLRAAAIRLSLKGAEGPDLEDPRFVEAVQALLLAIRGHFPSVFLRYFDAPVFSELIPAFPDGRLIKLKRQATAVLSTYL